MLFEDREEEDLPLPLELLEETLELRVGRTISDRRPSLDERSTED